MMMFVNIFFVGIQDTSKDNEIFKRENNNGLSSQTFNKKVMDITKERAQRDINTKNNNFFKIIK